MKSYKPFVCVVVVFSLYFFAIIILTWPLSEFSVAKSGTLGDSFGVLNTLFTGLGFAGLLVTLRQQQQQISSQDEYERKQDKQQSQERFESRFFVMLNLFSNNLEKIKFTEPNDGVYFGVEALKRINERIGVSLNNGRTLDSIDKLNEYEIVLYDHEYIANVRKSYVLQARYLETLECLLLFVERECPSESRDFYIRLVETQITSVEYKYLYYSLFVLSKGTKLRDFLLSEVGFLNAIVSAVNSKTKRKIIERRMGAVLPKSSSSYSAPLISKQELKHAKQGVAKQMREKRIEVLISQNVLHEQEVAAP